MAMATATTAALPQMSGSLELVTELIWQHALNHLQKTKNEILLPEDISSLIGGASVEIIKDRLGNLLNTPVVAFEDSVNHVYRIMPTPALDGRIDTTAMAGVLPTVPSGEGSQTYRSANINDSSNKEKSHAKSPKIPRPPNAFILYRQHHHPLMKAAHPEYHNNDISIALGKKWKAENLETREHFKALASEIKRKHAEDHPDYQYAPRKPSEKKRRCTTRRDGLSSTSKGLLADSAAPASNAIAQNTTAGIFQNEIYDDALSPSSNASGQVSKNNDFDAAPVSTSQEFEAMLSSHSSQFIMGFEEGDFLSFQRRRRSPVSPISNANIATSISPENIQQFGIPHLPGSHSSPENWGGLTFDFDDYFIGDGQ